MQPSKCSLRDFCFSVGLIMGVLLFVTVGSVIAASSASGSCVNKFTNPFGTKFGWGSYSNIAAPLNFKSVWIGGEKNGGLSAWSATATNNSCGGCNQAKTIAGQAGNVSVFYTYFIGFQAKQQAGLADCNTSNPPNLCTNASQWIRDNRAQLVNAYGQYAKAVYAASPNKPCIWWLEGDFVQYTYTGQVNHLTFEELGQLAKDIACAIKTNEPGAIVAMNHSPWISQTNTNDFWNAMPPEIDMCWLQAPADAEKLNNSYAVNGRWDSLSVHIKHRPIMAETSYGNPDRWTTTTAANINARIAEGAIAVHFNSSGYSTSAISTMIPQLNATMASYTPPGADKVQPQLQGSHAAVDAPKIIRSGNSVICSDAGTGISIFSLTGKQVMRQTVSGINPVNISNLPNGVYFARSGKAMLKFIR